MPLLSSPSPYGMSPGLESEARRETPDYARKTWKAYHEPQARVAERRQYSRPVNVEPLLWGDLICEKLTELVEGERNHPRTVVSGGAADREGGHCLLPELDDVRFRSGHDRAIAAAVGKPKVLRFSDEGSEYTADKFGAGGDFNEMYERRYTGFDGRTEEAQGLAAERAWSRAGRPGNAVREGHRERRSRERKIQAAQSIPWDLGTTQAAGTATPATPDSGGRGVGSADSGRSRSHGNGGGSTLAGDFGDDLFAVDAAAVLAAGRDQGGKNRGQLDSSDMEAHPSPHIGPDTHCLIPEEVELVHQHRDEESADGSNASLATQMEHRLVPVGGAGGAARKLRGTAARERQERARIVSRDLYVEEAVRRNRVFFTGVDDGDDGDSDDDNDDDSKATSCSVATFEAYYTNATQAADALPTAERGLQVEQPDADQAGVIPEDAQALTPAAPVAAVPPTPAAADKERRREERRAERAAMLKAKRRQAKRSTAIVDTNGSAAPSDTSLRRFEGAAGDRFGDAGDEISIAPSMSSLGSFDEHSGNVLPLAFQQARKAGTTDTPLPAVLIFPPALDHTAGKDRQALRRSGRSTPLALPSATTTTGAGTEEGSASSSLPPTDGGSAATVAGAVRTERERKSSQLGIAFGGAGRRRRTRRLSSSSSAVGGVRSADSPVAVDRDGREQSVASATGRLPLMGTAGSAAAPDSRSTTAVTTTVLLKRKIDLWRSRAKPPPKVLKIPKVPNRSSAPTTTPTGEDELSRNAAISSAPAYYRGKSDRRDGRPGRDGSAASMAPPVYNAINGKLQHQLPAARGGVTYDARTLAGSVTSSLTSLGGPVGGPMSVGPRARTDSSVASFASTSPGSDSAALVGGHSVAGSAPTTASAAMQGATAGLAGAEVGAASAGVGDEGASGGGTRGRLDPGERNKSTKMPRARWGTGTVGHVHKISLGSKRHQKSMKPAERTVLLIGACEWGDLKALERLLELGASPLDPYSPSVEVSRCVFCQYFLFVLQVGAGLRPRLAPDDSLHTRALAMLIEAALETNPRFLSIPKIRDQDDRGFCLLHHAAAFGNASKVNFLLERGVDPDVRAEGDDETALLVAARRGQRPHLGVAAALIRAGANMLARDRKGMTALHHAADVGRKHMCHYLLLVGADKTAQDNEGRTPLDLCHEKHPRVSALLRSFRGCLPPPATILDYMEKVEVHGLDDSTAQALMLQEQAARKEAEALDAAPAAAVSAANAADAIFGDDANSMASWDAASLGGMSGEGASVLSLGSLAKTTWR